MWRDDAFSHSSGVAGPSCFQTKGHCCEDRGRAVSKILSLASYIWISLLQQWSKTHMLKAVLQNTNRWECPCHVFCCCCLKPLHCCWPVCCWTFRLVTDEPCLCSFLCLYSESIKKTGTKGCSLTVVSNHVPICCQNKAVYQYHVTFTWVSGIKWQAFVSVLLNTTRAKCDPPLCSGGWWNSKVQRPQCWWHQIITHHLLPVLSANHKNRC